MQIRRLLRTAVVILSGFLLAIATYVALYTVILSGVNATAEIDPAKGTKTMRYIPAYHRPQFLSREWTETIARGFAPIHHVDTFVRPTRWKDQVKALSSEELQKITAEIAAENAAEADQNQRNSN